ncbi:MAG TPA: 16S rRNA (adenine(1518)-N(6)/adenine(1519)-N(6))-dimethyltransferase RsmA [Aestuariivirgaceae bacterium]|jgi:16S rRNA (adenine1518-N6/adenine1519-N6)-dimethyltransferase
MTTPALPPLRDVIARHGLTARKGLGQNFLLDLNLTRRIARAAGPLHGYRVIEVGPGPGGLTRALLEEGAQEVIAIERDARAMAALDEIAAAYPGRLTVRHEDALKTDWRSLASGPIKIAANLPYNIATVLLTTWLTQEPWPPWWESLTVMFQKEVAERIVAAQGNKAYGRLSVLAQWRARAAKLFDIDRRAFTPPPKVTSSLVRITPAQPCIAGLDAKAVEALTAHAFGQRRKMLRTSLKGLVAHSDRLISEAGIAPTARPEELAVAELCRLAALASAERAAR